MNVKSHSFTGKCRVCLALTKWHIPDHTAGCEKHNLFFSATLDKQNGHRENSKACVIRIR
jgi:hypothetical protein